MGKILRVDFNLLSIKLGIKRLSVRNEREIWLGAAVWCLCIQRYVTVWSRLPHLVSAIYRSLSLRKTRNLARDCQGELFAVSLGWVVSHWIWINVSPNILIGAACCF